MGKETKPKTTYRICENEKCSTAGRKVVLSPEANYCGNCGHKRKIVAVADENVVVVRKREKPSGLEQRTEPMKITKESLLRGANWDDLSSSGQKEIFQDELIRRLRTEFPETKFKKSHWRIITGNFFAKSLAEIEYDEVRVYRSEYALEIEIIVQDINKMLEVHYEAVDHYIP